MIANIIGIEGYHLPVHNEIFPLCTDALQDSTIGWGERVL
jgi:hypothetical protein